MSRGHSGELVAQVLIIGAGAIGTVYGAHLGAAGHAVWVLAHGARTADVSRDGLRARDVLGDGLTESRQRSLTEPTVRRSISHLSRCAATTFTS
jgi:ketopantoate reductase